MAYATVADLRERFDERTIAELVSDSGAAVDLVDLATDTNALTALIDASGMVDAALLVSGRYTTTQLSALTGNALGLLKRIVCHLTMAALLDRRPDFDPDRYAKLTEWAFEQLEKLRTGENIFNLEDQIAASKPNLETPTITERLKPGLIRDRTRNYFPRINLPGMN